MWWRNVFLGLLLGLTGCQKSAPPPKATQPAKTPVRAPAPPPFPKADISQLITAFSKEFPGNSGICVGPIEEPDSVSHNGQRSFEAASLVKLPILIELARRLEKGTCPPGHQLVFEERFRVGGSGRLKEQSAGGKYPVEQLAQWMIQESDNVATDMLLEYLGQEQTEASLSPLGLTATTVRRNIFDFAAIDLGRDNLTSPKDMARLLSLVGQNKLPRSAWIKELLMGTKNRSLLLAQIDPQIRVAHKSGELTGFLHDIALFEGQSPWLLVVLTEGAEVETAKPALQKLGQQIYERISSKAKNSSL